MCNDTEPIDFTSDGRMFILSDDQSTCDMAKIDCTKSTAGQNVQITNSTVNFKYIMTDYKF